MKKWILFIVGLSLATGDLSATAPPDSTTVIVRARAADAKFVGSSMGGVHIVIREVKTGRILASGLTEGSTGDTGRLMNTPVSRYTRLSTPGAAKFEAALALDRPVFVSVEASGPRAQLQSSVTVSTQLWLIPGKDITGDGIMLELPGFSVDLMSPRAHESAGMQEISIRANVVMMCGCPTSPGGLWDSDDFEIKAIIEQDNRIADTVPLSFAGETSKYEGSFLPEKEGAYVITVYAYDPRTGNTGVDQTTVVVSDR